MQSSALRQLPPRGFGRVKQQPPPPPALESAAFEAAATLAARTPVGSETIGADGKAAGLLTLLGIMFTVLARFGPELSSVLHGGGPVRILSAIALMGFATTALCAVVQAFRTISPRFIKCKPSLAFFGEIARLSREDYVYRVESMTMEEAVGQILAYNHTAAMICAEKYRQLRLAIRFFEAAAACWLLLAGTLVIKGLYV